MPCCPAGWVGGIFILLLFYVITLWSSLMLAECQETNGVKHPTYRAAVLHVLGEQQQQQQQLDGLIRAWHSAEI
jgi:amino acid permease